MSISKKNSKKRSKRLKKVARRLAAYSAAAAATAVATQGSVNAADVVWDIPDVPIVGPGTHFNLISGNTTAAAVSYSTAAAAVEGSFKLGHFATFYPGYMNIAGPFNSSSAAFVGHPGAVYTSFFYASALAAGATVSSGKAFVGHADALSYGIYAWLDEFEGPPGFVGLKFDIAGSTHYGWAEISDTDAQNAGGILHGFGYQTIAGDPSITPTISTADDPLDTNLDKLVNSTDIDTIYGDPAFGGAGSGAVDYNDDLVIDQADVDDWLTDFGTVKGDVNLDKDVDIWDFDGSGDAQILSSNLGTPIGAVWGDGDFNGDGDVDVWDFDGSGDAQVLSSNLGFVGDVGPDAADGTAEALYDPATGELSFDIGSGVAVVGIGSAVMYPGAVDAGSIFGAPIQSNATTLAYFDTGGLPTGEDSVGLVLPPGLTQEQLTFSYTPTSGPTQKVDVTIIPEPSSILLLAAGAAGLALWRRRRNR